MLKFKKKKKYRKHDCKTSHVAFLTASNKFRKAIK